MFFCYSLISTVAGSFLIFLFLLYFISTSCCGIVCWLTKVDICWGRFDIFFLHSLTSFFCCSASFLGDFLTFYCGYYTRTDFLVFTSLSYFTFLITFFTTFFTVWAGLFALTGLEAFCLANFTFLGMMGFYLWKALRTGYLFYFRMMPLSPSCLNILVPSAWWLLQKTG